MLHHCSSACLKVHCKVLGEWTPEFFWYGATVFIDTSLSGHVESTMPIPVTVRHANK